MDFTLRRAVALLGILFIVSWSVTSHARSASLCTTYNIAAGQRTLTPSVVLGARGEHLVLKGFNPAADSPRGSPDDGYVIAGDHVDMVTQCDDIAYIRFHGNRRVSTGWVDASRLRASGSDYVPLPPNAAGLCKAAQDDWRSGTLHVISMDRVASTTALDKLTFGEEMGSHLASVAHVAVGGHKMSVIISDDGGTAGSTEAFILTSEMDARLSPPDMDARRIENDGEDDWAFGLGESLVTVLGQPMIMEAGPRSAHVTFAAIDRTGDVIPTCVGVVGPLPEPAVNAGFDGSMCRALISGQQDVVSMGPPSSGETLFVPHVPDDFISEDKGEAPSVSRHFRNKGRASQVTYELTETGTVDLNNDGHPRRVGLVSYFDGNSTGGDGSYQESWFRPVYLDAQGRADPATPENLAIAKQLPSDMTGGRLVAYGNATYLELSAANDGRINEVWKFGKTGPKKVCEFQLDQMAIHVVTAKDKG